MTTKRTCGGCQYVRTFLTVGSREHVGICDVVPGNKRPFWYRNREVLLYLDGEDCECYEAKEGAEDEPLHSPAGDRP